MIPCSLDDAKAFVTALHRHHKAPLGGLWAVAAADGTGRVVGVAVVGRPVARMLDDGWTTEVTRLCTDGARNACSLLYGAARRGALARGYVYGLTYVLATESGGSLLASGWRRAAEVKGAEWSRPSRQRAEGGEVQRTDKVRWEWGQRATVALPRVERANDGGQGDLFELAEIEAPRKRGRRVAWERAAQRSDS